MDNELTEKLHNHYGSLKNAGKISVLASADEDKNIPVLTATGKCLPEAWENSLINLYMNGFLLRTQYDRQEGGKFVDPPSKDCSMVVVIEDPLSEPFIHRAFPGGLEDLEEYRQEVIDGIKDHWVRGASDKEGTKWEYTYHERMRNYSVPGLEGSIDQFEQMAQNIAKSPITRRAQMSSWKVWQDNQVGDPACWQSYWGRITKAKDGKSYLNLNMRFRSRDAFKAAFMNDFAFVLLGKNLAERISEIRREEVKLGRLIDQSDSYHIYGKDLKEFEDIFLKQVLTRTFENRTWRISDQEIQDDFEDAKETIRAKIAAKDAEDAKK